MSNVYDDVAELQTHVAESQSEATHWFALDTTFLIN